MPPRSGLVQRQSSSSLKSDATLRAPVLAILWRLGGISVIPLLLLAKSHLEEFMPRLILVNHLADLNPFAFFVSRDGVPHPATLWNLQCPLQRVRAHLGFSIYLPFGGERMPAEFVAAMVIRNEGQSRVNRRTVFLCFAHPFNDQNQTVQLGFNRFALCE